MRVDSARRRRRGDSEAHSSRSIRQRGKRDRGLATPPRRIARAAPPCRASAAAATARPRRTRATAAIVASVGNARGRNRRGAACGRNQRVWLRRRLALHSPAAIWKRMKIIVVAGLIAVSSRCSRRSTTSTGTAARARGWSGCSPSGSRCRRASSRSSSFPTGWAGSRRPDSASRRKGRTSSRGLSLRACGPSVAVRASRRGRTAAARRRRRSASTTTAASNAKW